MRTARALFACVIVAMACEGCALLKKKAPPPPAPPGTVVAPVAGKRKAALTLTAASEVNPDRNDRSSPVLVRVYQLKADAAFKTAQFDDLYDDDKKVLGEAYVARHDVTLAPGGKQQLELPLADETGYIGVVAAFRDILSSSSQWRAVAPVPRKGLLVSVAGTRVSLMSSE